MSGTPTDPRPPSSLDPPPVVPAFFYVTAAPDGTITDHGAGDTVPIGSTAITSEQYDTIVAMLPLQCRLLDGVLTVIPLPEPGPVGLSAIQEAATIQVDVAAEAARLLFLTAGSGQTLEYIGTQADAIRALASPDPLAAADYPWLQPEVAALASIGTIVELRQVAQSVVAMMDDWSAKGAAIKQVRRIAKERIGVATTVEEVQAILAGLVWPAP